MTQTDFAGRAGETMGSVVPTPFSFNDNRSDSGIDGTSAEAFSVHPA
jgi:hypothetical protein